MVHYAKSRDTGQKRSSGFGAFLAIVIIVAVAVFGYHTYRDRDDALYRPTVEGPAKSPQDPNSSPIHSSPSPSPGP